MAYFYLIKITKMAYFLLTIFAKMVNYKCMNLKELRKQNDITQKEAALMVGIPYRTYIRYEENEQYAKSYKYKKIMDDLSNLLKVDEEHGLLTIEKIKELLIPVLESHNISFCYLFGSYAKKTAKESSDVDLLVDTDITGLAFFGLVEEIREILHKKIDLLRLKDLSSDNPIVLEILKEGVRII